MGECLREIISKEGFLMTVVQKSVLFAATLLALCVAVLYLDSAHYDGCSRPCEPFEVLGFSTMTVVGSMLLAGVALMVIALAMRSIQTRSWW